MDATIISKYEYLLFSGRNPPPPPPLTGHEQSVWTLIFSRCIVNQ